jgi:TPR repeat protein
MSKKIIINIQDNYGQINIATDHSVMDPYHQATQPRLGKPSWTSEGVIVSQNPAGFQPFYSWFLREIQLSLQHPLDHLLLLADRVLMHAQYDTNKKELKGLPKQLKRLKESGLDQLSSDTKSFLSSTIPKWLDTLYQCLLPEKWEQNKNKSDETQIWLDLELPLKKGFAPQELFQINDPTNFFRQWLAAFLLPLDQHYLSLRSTLRSIVLQKQHEKDHDHLQRIIEERQLHLQKYVDRPEPLREVIEQLKNTKKKYLLITGIAGIGKTAFCSKLSEELANPTQHYSSLPWLPNIILHYCKQLKTPKEIIETWLTQANLLLVNNLSLSPHFHLEQQDAHKLMRKAMSKILHQLTLECGEIIFLIDALDELSIALEDLSFLPETLPDEAKVIISVRTGSQTETWLKKNRQTTIYELAPLKREEIPLFTKLDDKIEKEFHDKLWAASQGWTLYVSFAVQEIRNKKGNLQDIEAAKLLHFYDLQLEKWYSYHHSSENKPLKEILGLLAIFEAVSPLSLAEIQSYLRSRQMDQSEQQLKSLLAHVGDQVSGVQSDSVMLQINTFAKYIREKCWNRDEYNKELSKMVYWLGTDSDISIKTVAQFVLTYSSEEHHLIKLIEYLEKYNPERIFHIGMYIFPSLFEGIPPKSTKLFIEYPAKNGNLKAMYLMSQFPNSLSENIKWSRKLHTKLKIENTTLKKLFQDDPILTEYFEEKKYQLFKDNEGAKFSDLFASLGYELKQWFRYDEAIYWLRKAASHHHTFAMSVLGDLLVVQGKTKRQIREGLQWLQKAAEAGDKEAIARLGIYLIEGNYLTRNIEKGEKWLRKAADIGDPQATRLLGLYLIEGKYLTQNIEEGELWLRKAADLGEPLAMTLLGLYLIKGKYLTQNIKEGEKWLRKAAGTEEPEAIRLLGQLLIEGKHLIQNTEEGAAWLRKAANMDDQLAMGLLGLYLLKGDLPRNIEEGERWLRKTADLGETQTICLLGQYLIEGEYLTQNIEEGVQWLRKAVDMGDPQAKVLLGYYLIEGEYLTQNIEEGVQWLHKAADIGDPQAMRLLGQYLIKGEYFIQNVKEGEKWLRRAAHSGDQIAMGLLGQYLIEGDFLTQNVEEGEKWLREAANIGNIEAIRLLGQYLIVGKYLTQNIEEGAFWLRKAANMDDQLAMSMLGFYLSQTQNFEEAAYWLRKASASPNEYSISNLLKKPIRSLSNWFRKKK